MQKKTYLLALLALAAIFAVSAPAYAQPSGLPPFSDKIKKPSSRAPSLPPSSDDFSPSEKQEPIEAKIFPYKNRPLRDPFWTVGYFPPQWGVEHKPKMQSTSASEWRIPMSQIEVSGVSRMGDRVMAIINGDLKEVGDLVEIFYLGKIFQWKVSGIQTDGNVRFDRYKIINDTPR